MTFERYQQIVNEMKPEQWRLGQMAFNTLYSERPDLSEQIRGTAFDPFHDDSALPRFYDWVEMNWNKPTKEQP